MDMIRHRMCFHYFHMFVFAESSKYFPYVFSQSLVYYFPAILRY